MSKKLTPELEKLKEEYDFLHKRIGELLPSPYFRRTAAQSRPCPNDGSRAKVFIVR